jgi:UDP-2,3-diacylglucosamine pyrophosphatase LpxH
MLVIVSDLHLTDGTTGQTIGAGAFVDFRQRLQELACDASKRPNDGYRPIERVELVLLGDIFDLIRSTKWSTEKLGEPGYVRPWDDPQSELYVQKVEEIVEAILAHNAAAFAVLKGLQEGDLLQVPTTPGSSERTAVPVNTWYVLGNHDWMLHLPGAAYDAMRQKITDALGLANPPGPYPHDPAEAPWLMALYGAHHVFARHGDIFDPFNYDKEKGRDAATLGDAIVVELINQFPQEVGEQMGDVLPPPFLAGLNELANVRPSLLVPAWVDALLNNMQIPPQQAAQVKQIWDELAAAFLKLPFVREQDERFKLDAVDVMEVLLRLYDRVSVGTAAQVIRFVQEKVWRGNSSFAAYALQEQAYREQWAHHIVYGHTHHYEMIPLNKIYDGYESLDQIYYNSGTWHPVHVLTKADKDQFVFFQVMTFMAFFQGDERRGRPFESWSGTLGVQPG